MNGCGGEGGFDFKILKNKISKLKFVDKKKLDTLYRDIEAQCCIPHDIDFERGGNIKDYIKSNYTFCIRLMKLLHWTNNIGRILIFIFVFTGLNIFGFRYFNFK